MRRAAYGGGARVRLRRGALAGALGALAIAGCGGTAHRSSTTRAVPAAIAPAPAPKPQRPAPPPADAVLGRALAKWLGKAGPNSGGFVYDLSRHRPLFSLRAETKRPPASVEKLYTTVALLAQLDPSTTFKTTVLAAGSLGPGGVWHGNLYLRGGGDPTFGDGAFNRTWELGYGPSDAQLVAQLGAAGIRKLSGRVIGDPSLFDALPGVPSSGYAPDVADLGGQLSALTYDHGSTLGAPSAPAFAVKQLVLTMRSMHLQARAAKATAPAPAGARQLALVSSPPLSVLIKLTDVPSDDFFAELLTKQLGVRFGAGGSTAAGAGVIHGVIAGYGVHPQIVDGSGLSRADQSSPAEVVALLRRIWHTPIGATLTASLPVVGVSGTVGGLAQHTPAQGRCFAKTGTLTGVSNLAGYCAAHGGDSLAFAFFLDGPSNSQAMPLLGHLVAAVARF